MNETDELQNLIFIQIILLIFLFIYMSQSPNQFANQKIGCLVKHLEAKAKANFTAVIKSIQKQRKQQLSCTHIPRKISTNKKVYNNHPSKGTFFQQKPVYNNYTFIPKYKQETLIMPDRALAKGKAAKKFYIKMKDSMKSFQDEESSQFHKHLKKQEKQKIIEGRQIQQLNRIWDTNDGRSKAIKQKSKPNRAFTPTNKSQYFSLADPDAYPKDLQSIDVKKLKMNRTLRYQNKRQITTATELFSRTMQSNQIRQSKSCSYR